MKLKRSILFYFLFSYRQFSCWPKMFIHPLRNTRLIFIIIHQKTIMSNQIFFYHIFFSNDNVASLITCPFWPVLKFVKLTLAKVCSFISSILSNFSYLRWFKISRCASFKCWLHNNVSVRTPSSFPSRFFELWKVL